MPKVQHSTKLRIVQLYREGWRPYAIRKQLADESQVLSKSSIQCIIDKHKSGHFTSINAIITKHVVFQKINDQDITTIDNAFSNDCNLSARDIQRLLLVKNNTEVSLSTVGKAIDAAGWVSTAPRYCQLIRDANKELGLNFAKTRFKIMKIFKM
ncbi:unnamed protein product [Mytilus coruscus]|uniref:Transposase Tc1-like domain-containing protein n=1 Tax=Mytilus coruscus TaxID=42192 RepID=A0A6J8EYE5_MYTCO|nr:unnamed protein product [Mytilus coruscus]